MEDVLLLSEEILGFLLTTSIAPYVF